MDKVTIKRGKHRDEYLPVVERYSGTVTVLLPDGTRKTYSSKSVQG